VRPLGLILSPNANRKPGELPTSPTARPWRRLHHMPLSVSSCSPFWSWTLSGHPWTMISSASHPFTIWRSWRRAAWAWPHGGGGTATSRPDHVAV